MGIWWVTTIGIVLCLGFVCGTFIHFFRQGIDPDDAKRIDRIQNESEES